MIALGLLSTDYALAQEHFCKDIDDALVQQSEWFNPATGTIISFNRSKPLEGTYLGRTKKNGNFRHFYEIKSENLDDGRKICSIIVMHESSCKGDVRHFFIEKIGKSIKFSKRTFAGKYYWNIGGKDLAGACEKEDDPNISWHISPHS